MRNAFLLFLITLVVYCISSRGEGAHWNYFVLLADSFLHGRLYLLTNPPWLNELINWQGHYYVVYPPMPAILLMPFVAFFGINFYQPLLSILIAAGNVVLSYLIILKVFQNKKIAIWIAILYAFGTMQWYHAEVGSTWYIAHIIAMFFIWLAILEILTRQRLFLIGLLIGFAYLSRLPTILAIIFPILYLYDKFFLLNKKKLITINFKNLFFLGGGLGVPVTFNFIYNYARYGVISDISYQLLPVFNESWYRYGLFNIRYLPIHLKEIFTAMPKLIPNFPFVTPSLNVMALWFVTPAFILILFARYREKIIWISLVTILLISIPGLVHGENGFTQFGFRFALDYLPFLLLLTACGLQNKFNWWSKLLIILSILVNLWGVVMISFLNIWTIQIRF